MPINRTFASLAAALLLALGLALLLAVGWLGAPGNAVVDLLLYLLSSGLISLALGIAGIAWLRRGQGRLWLQIILAYSLGVGIALFNVFLTAQLMFISADHDLVLLVLLLLFASVVSIALGYALARTLTHRVTALALGARDIASGNLQARVPLTGSDELTDLAHEFNRMAARLEEAEMERARQEDARRELVAAISHDLRTPLASLRAMTEALSDGVVNDPETTERYLTTMRGQITHLNGLIDDLFELAQLDAGAVELDRQLVAPVDLVSDVIGGMQPQAAAKQIDIATEIAPNLAPLFVEPQKLERVLYNLIDNAIRHTPPGGQVRISVTAATPAGTPQVAFEVSDSGEGIAPEDLPLIFERFYRGEKSRSRSTGGAGLGLAIARGIVEAHGGAITATSSPGHGTSVCFVIPQQGAS